MENNRRSWVKQIGLVVAGSYLVNFKLIASSAQGLFKKTQPILPKQSFKKGNTIIPGAFSISLSVKDLNASKQFYESLGFNVFGGAIKNNYLIMKNGNALIGLFYGMFEKNILTFNPGWDENANKFEPFDDVREIQKQLKLKGIKFESEADENTKGPASFIVLDPDGNTILFDQHI